MIKEMNSNILKYVPKSKREAVDSAWHDSDGYWICLKDDWNADHMDVDCHTIHEDTIKELRYQISGINRKKDIESDLKTTLEFKRQLKKMTQKTLSELSGVNIRMIQHYEQGVKDINKAQAITLYKLAQVLECKIEDLLEIE